MVSFDLLRDSKDAHLPKELDLSHLHTCKKAAIVACGLSHTENRKMKKYLAGCALVLASTFATGAMAEAVSASLGAVTIAAGGTATGDGAAGTVTGTALLSIATSVATGGAAISASAATSSAASSAAGGIATADVALYGDLTAEGAVDGTSTVIFALAP